MELRKYCVILLVIACAISTFARERQTVRLLEGGLYVGIDVPIDSYHGGKAMFAPMFGGEARANLIGSPFDVGMYLQFDCAKHKFEGNDGELRQKNRTFVVGAVSHYNFQQGDIVNPYIGLGFGVGLNDVVGDRLYPVKCTTLVVSPRVGIELWHHLRLSLECQICRSGFNLAGLRLGFVIGGRPRLPNEEF